MKIKSLASSSLGNCYIIESGGQRLILESGVCLDKVFKAINHRLDTVSAVLVSHRHGDHARYINEFEKNTTWPIFCENGLKNAFHLNKCFDLEHNKQFRTCETFSFQAIKLKHDVTCFGFIVYSHAEKEKILFITDTGYINKQIKPGFDILMIEANHDIELLDRQDLDQRAKDKIIRNHLNIDQTINFIIRHPAPKEIHLIHLSRGNSNAIEFKRRVQEVAGCPVYVANE